MAAGDLPSISVLLPVFNGQCWLIQCIESVLAQDFTDFELLIIDDGSTDNSLSIIRKYSSLDSRIRYLQQENKGLASALNRGINASIGDMGEYLKVLLGHRPDIISKESLADLFNPVICTSDKDTYVNLWDGVSDSYYAIGWRILDYRGRRVIYHGGNVNEYKTQLLVDPDNGIAICALFNAPNPFNGPVMPTFLNYYDFYKEMRTH